MRLPPVVSRRMVNPRLLRRRPGIARPLERAKKRDRPARRLPPAPPPFGGGRSAQPVRGTGEHWRVGERGHRLVWFAHANELTQMVSCRKAVRVYPLDTP